MLQENCIELFLLKGLSALRLSFLYDGTHESASKVPDKELFVNNEYKKYGDVKVKSAE